MNTYYDQQQSADDVYLLDGECTMKHVKGTPHAVDFYHQSSKSEHLRRRWDGEEVIAVLEMEGIERIVFRPKNKEFEQIFGFERNADAIAKCKSGFWHIGRIVYRRLNGVVFESFRECPLGQQPEDIFRQKGQNVR
jgi:hypothetical protein